jgi:hypothetical protein
MKTLNCFVIMPFSKAPVRLVADKDDGLREVPTSCGEHHPKDDPNVTSLDFGKVYKHIIQKAVERVNTDQREAGVQIKCQRGEDLLRGGNMVPQFVREICCADITITDVTGLNPNVLLELGIRLSVRDSLNIILCHKSVIMPFDIRDQRYIEYSQEIDAADTAADEIERWIVEALPALLRGTADTAENFFRRTVELATGRDLERKLIKPLEAGPDLMARLWDALQAQGRSASRPDPHLRHEVWDYLASVGHALQDDPTGRERAIQLYELLTTLPGFSGKHGELFNKLWKLCSEDPNRGAQADGYLAKLRELEQ